MLVLSRDVGEVIVIRIPATGETIKVKLIDTRGISARIGFEADRSIEIDRLEIFMAKEDERGTNSL